MAFPLATGRGSEQAETGGPMRPMYATLPLALALLVACGRDTGAELAKVLPDDRVEVNLPSDTSTARTGETAELYTLTRDVPLGVNGMIGGVLLLVDGVVDNYPPTTTTSDASAVTATWGPVSQNALDPKSTRMWVTHDL